MKKTKDKKTNPADGDKMPDHYEFDYSKAKPNRFAPVLAEQEGFIQLQPDIRKVFKTSDQVNTALRAFINAIPKRSSKLLEKV